MAAPTAAPAKRLLKDREAWAYLADVSTGTPAAYTVAPCRGDIIGLKATRYATLAGSDTVVTCNINGTNITGGTITLVAAGDAAGDVTASATITAANRVQEGDYIGFVSGGESDDATVPVMFVATIRPC